MTAILVSVLASKAGVALLARRKLESEMRALGNVDSPHNQGKLGSLLLAHGRAARALPHLERAVAGEPESAEWKYRLGRALIELRRPEEAIAPLEGAAAIDEEHAYGGVQLALSQARLDAGDPQGALTALEVFERNHGENPESAYRRGLAHRAADRKDEARAQFARVPELARQGARFQRDEHRRWVLRAFFARLV